MPLHRIPHQINARSPDELGPSTAANGATTWRQLPGTSDGGRRGPLVIVIGGGGAAIGFSGGGTIRVWIGHIRAVGTRGRRTSTTQDTGHLESLAPCGRLDKKRRRFEALSRRVEALSGVAETGTWEDGAETTRA
ncbi:hypothetical protein C8F01DRAFT_1080596 [Mycena amicta]|nr:hypothetical protein C8F01DRAFT_1080596 [Mycena amicta]